MQVIHVYARAQGLALTTAIAHLLETEELRPKARNTLRALLDEASAWDEVTFDDPRKAPISYATPAYA